ncbi:hypothetical protein IKJ53_04840 [bacterium]|nr:hypothetical protein [bacterium]
MSIRPIAFAATSHKSTKVSKELQEIRHKNNPFRTTDLIPLSVCCGLGLMTVYAVKSGKMASVKKFIHLA